MFMPKKVDPLVGIATSVMKEGDLRRGAEKLTNETLGVFSRRELPHERYAEYDALLIQNVDQALGKAKTLTEETEQPVTINETRQQTLERFIREQKKFSKKDVADFHDFEHGDKSGGKEKTYTHVHKTSGKEVVTTKPTHGSDWSLKEDNVDENFESIKRAKANWDKANKGTKAEKQKNEILGWHEKSHKKKDADETKTK